MIPFFLALALIVALMLTYLTLVQVAVDPGSRLRRTHRRFSEARQARRAVADLDREYARLTSKYRRTP
ncbi:MAG: hypothetical protein ACRYG2_08290 [Janthinobacterium lividum]